MLPFRIFSRKPIGTVATQLRKSFVFVNCIIAVFFIIYLFQAYFLYERSNVSDQLVIHTNDVLNNVKSADANNQKIQSAVASYLLTHDPTDIKNAKNCITALKSDISHLMWLASDNQTEQGRMIDFSRLADRKIALSENLINQGTESKTYIEPKELIKVNENIDKALVQIEHAEMQKLAMRTNNNRYYSKSRIVFSLISYVIASTFLIIAFYKINHNIRKRTDAEEKAKANEAKYKTLVEDSGLIMLVINNSGIINFASKSIAELTGHKAEEYIGLPFVKCVSAPFRNLVSDIVNIAVHKGGYRNTAELQLFTNTNENKWVSCRISPVNNESAEWQIILWDIDEEKKLQLEIGVMEAERRKQQKLTQDILDNIPSAIYVKDLNGRYLMLNKKIEEFTGMPLEKIAGCSDRELIQDTGKYLETKHSDDRVLAYKTFITTEEVVNRNGRTQYYLVTKFPLFDENGKVKNICGLATDITEQKENELKLIEAKREAEKARVAQETFLANMSHEIRTPMNGIIGMGNLLMGTNLNQEQYEFTENIQESAKNLLSIINDILDFSKIKSGKFRFEHTPFKFRQAIKKAIYPLRFKAEEKMIKINLSVDPAIPEILIGDPVRLQQVIINLVGNAIKFTSGGTVDICITGKGNEEGRCGLSIDVKDTGIGIAQNKLDYIFESFTQNNVNTSRKYGGTGLGLAIVKQLVELQNGNVSVSSTLGLGSTFSATIPFAVGEENAVQETKLSGEEAGQKEVLDGIKILVAEDNIINQKVVRNTLQKQGAMVEIVMNGKEAVDHMRDNVYDVVLMDLQMPEVDGYKATRYIRQVMKSEVPILAMTADALKGEAEKCFEAGMTGFISKPFEPNDLYLQILKVTRDKQTKHILSDNQKTMEQPIVDFSFLYEISDNDPQYISDVIDIFLSTMPEGLEKLEDVVRNTNDWEAIYKQAHFLKSSVSVVKVRDMFDNLGKIEALAKQQGNKEEMIVLLDTILSTFSEAHPVVLAEKDKNKPV